MTTYSSKFTSCPNEIINMSIGNLYTSADTLTHITHHQKLISVPTVAAHPFRNLLRIYQFWGINLVNILTQTFRNVRRKKNFFSIWTIWWSIRQFVCALTKASVMLCNEEKTLLTTRQTGHSNIIKFKYVFSWILFLGNEHYSRNTNPIKCIEKNGQSINLFIPNGQE